MKDTRISNSVKNLMFHEIFIQSYISDSRIQRMKIVFSYKI